MRILMLAHRIPYLPTRGTRSAPTRSPATSPSATSSPGFVIDQRRTGPSRSAGARNSGSEWGGLGSLRRSRGDWPGSPWAAPSASPTFAPAGSSAVSRGVSGTADTTRYMSLPRRWPTTFAGRDSLWSWTSSTWIPTSGPSMPPINTRRDRGPTASKGNASALSRQRLSAGVNPASSPPVPRRRCSGASRPGPAPRWCRTGWI
jgi:hypothetical protein